MKQVFTPLVLVIVTLAVFAEEEDHEEEIAIDPASLIILDEVKVANLGIEVEDSLDTDFEETVFAIGRINDIPTNHAALSSRISGRALHVGAIPGDHVTKDQVLVRVESRRPRAPGQETPPIIPLHAPITGTVLESHIRPGEPVEPENKLFDIVDLTEVWAIARVPEQEAGRMKIGTKARIRVTALPTEIFEGELIRWGTKADVGSGTLEAIFRLKNEELQLRPGMRAEFSIITSLRQDVTAVPRAAVRGDPAGRLVYIPHEDLPHTFIKAPVVTGAQNDRYIEIISGIFPGDPVVTTGSYFLGASTGGMSLKEALDAAHGHEHNEDGSIMTDEQKAARDAAKGIVAEEKSDSGPRTLFFTITTIIFFFLLVLSGMKHHRDSRYFAELSNQIRPESSRAAPLSYSVLPTEGNDELLETSKPANAERAAPQSSEVGSESDKPKSGSPRPTSDA